MHTHHANPQFSKENCCQCFHCRNKYRCKCTPVHVCICCLMEVSLPFWFGSDAALYHHSEPEASLLAWSLQVLVQLWCSIGSWACFALYCHILDPSFFTSHHSLSVVAGALILVQASVLRGLFLCLFSHIFLREGPAIIQIIMNLSWLHMYVQLCLDCH